jgi:hypothetical protein
LADLVDACLAPALAAQGFAAADVVVAWPDIVGERLVIDAIFVAGRRLQLRHVAGRLRRLQPLARPP